MHRTLIASLCLFPGLALSARAQVHEHWLDVRNVSPTGHDEIRAVAVAPSGNVYATGRTGSLDLLLLKYGPNGAVLWTRTYDAGQGLDDGFGIAIDPATETIHVVGRGDVQSTHGLALAYDSAGNHLWSAVDDVGPGASQFSAARLTDAGQASLAHDTLALTSAGEVPGALSALFQGRARTAPSPFGDGLLCVGQNVLRLYVAATQGGVAQMPAAGDPSISVRSAALGDPIAPGASRFYQMCYRDSVSITCPPPQGGPFNLSSGLAVVWE